MIEATRVCALYATMAMEASAARDAAGVTVARRSRALEPGAVGP